MSLLEANLDLHHFEEAALQSLKMIISKARLILRFLMQNLAFEIMFLIARNTSPHIYDWGCKKPGARGHCRTRCWHWLCGRWGVESTEESPAVIYFSIYAGMWWVGRYLDSSIAYNFFAMTHRHYIKDLINYVFGFHPRSWRVCWELDLNYFHKLTDVSLLSSLEQTNSTGVLFSVFSTDMSSFWWQSKSSHTTTHMQPFETFQNEPLYIH